MRTHNGLQVFSCDRELSPCGPYLAILAVSVEAACDRFLRSRGLEPTNHFKAKAHADYERNAARKRRAP